MREVTASEAKTHLLRLLDQVEQGETIVITRHGKRVAWLESNRKRQAQLDRTIARIRELGRENAREHGPVKVDEILSARDEGRR